MKDNKIIGFKGFDKDLKCKDFQYEVGKTFECEGNISCCKNGFHFCENPLDVFTYYSPSNSRYCSVEGEGDISVDGCDSKVAVSKLHVLKEIGLKDIINAGINFILDKVNRRKSIITNVRKYPIITNTKDYSIAIDEEYQSVATNTGNHSVAANIGDCSVATNTGHYSIAINKGNRSITTNIGDYSFAINMGCYSSTINTGNYSTAINTGDYSIIANTEDYSTIINKGNYSTITNIGNRSTAINIGNYSVAINTGNRSATIVEGKDSVAIVTGIKSKAKGVLNSWIVLTEHEEWNGKIYPIKEIKAFKVDGILIKENTYYQLINGNAVEVD